MSFQYRAMQLGVGVVRGEIKTGKGSSPSWRFLSALTCGRGLEPTSGEGRGPKRRSILNGSNRKEASLARKRRNNILKGGTCKSGIEPRKAWEMNFFSVSIILKRKN
ncbi:TPA: hypothetical protein BOS_16221 [Bos taurus]|nr:TPA: hypothetical protein BOS_16221 [Bos taurus]